MDVRESTGAVPFAFGCLGAERVPGPILVTVLGDLGVPAPTARRMLARMVGRGMLATERFGRVTRYGLTGPVAGQFRRIRDGEAPPTWTGGFETVVYDLPEHRRRERDEIRAAAFRAGFGAPRPGLLIGLGDPAPWLGPATHGLGTDDFVETGRLACSEAAAVRLAERAWRLAGLAASLREDLERTRAATAEVKAHAPAGARALRLAYGLFADSARHRLAAPTLPAELLPPGWPEADLSHAIGELVEALYPTLSAYVHEVTARSPHAALIVRPSESA